MTMGLTLTRGRSAAQRRSGARRTVLALTAMVALSATVLVQAGATAPGAPSSPAVAGPVDGNGLLARARAAGPGAVQPNVKVVDLRVNGLYDEPLGLGDPSPILAWRIEETPAASSHRCRRSGPQVPCPADEQTAYQIQVAERLRDFDAGDLLWDSGKVAGGVQSGVRYAGEELRSRQHVAWRVRVWDADGAPSDWKSTGRWEMGLMQQGDWGAARWIEYPGRVETQPLPIFARGFDVGRNVAHARLYVSGLGVQLATVNGKKLTDEVLAPGYSNWQLSAEYRTYDVTDELVAGANTVGVQLGSGTAYVRRSATNPAVGRTAPYSWWQSVLKGSGTLVAPAAAGATNVMPSSTANYHIGGTINVDTGNGGDDLESRVITAIGTAPTTVAAPNVITGAVAPTLTGANWIWNVAGANTNTPGGTIYVRKTFEVVNPSGLASAILRVNADDGHTTFVNGTQVSSSAGANNAWQTSQLSDIKSLLVPGTNVIAIAPFNSGGAGSLIAVAELDSTRIVTDGTWKALPGTTTSPPLGWNTVAFDDSAWPAANVTGAYGIAPWNQNVQNPPGPSTLRVASVQGFAAGHQIRIDTGPNEEIRTIQSVGTAGATGSGLTLTQPLAIVHAVGAVIENLTNPNTGISFTPALGKSHQVGALVTGSGNNIAASDPSAGAAVTPRMIARLEITYRNGSTDVVVSDRSWRAALGAYTTDAWYSGSDYDARREPVGWDVAGADLSATAKRRDGSDVAWIDAGIAPPPNLATKLVARDAPPVRIVEKLVPKRVTNPLPGTYVFDFGQNFAGWPQLNLTTPVPAGTVIRMAPAEGLAANGSGLIDQGSLGPSGGRGTNMFNTYTAAGGGPETWRPDFQYFGMQFLQVTGLPADYPVTTDLITGFRLQGDAPASGTVTTSNERVNRIHRMAQYSFASNTLTIFTDCPGREKQSYPADYTMVMGAIERNFELASYLRGHMRHFAEGQSMADTFMRGNVALKVPVHDVGFAGQFGDEINWGNGIILVPAFLYELYGDADTMATYYDEMVLFHDYIVREKAGAGALPDHIVNAALSDWVSAQQTSGEISGTWGYYVMTDKLAKMATLTGHAADAAEYAALAQAIGDAFNARFYNTALKRYATNGGAGGTTGATQVAQALALDAGLVPEADRQAVLDYLVENIYAFHPSGDSGPHLSGGTIGLAPTVRALTDGGRDDVLWDVLQQDAQPSYGFFLQPTNANPEGFTTIGEQWNRGASRNHMILAQIEEWFHEGLAGIRQAAGSREYRELVIKPRLVGDLTSVEGSYRSPQGLIRSGWTKKPAHFNLRVEIPANTAAEVWVPKVYEKATAPARAKLVRSEGDYTVYEVGSGVYSFTSSGDAVTS
jgi:alpha-L-rhamnosidase